MAHFADLENTTQIVAGPYVRAIGWLSAAQSYPMGTAPEAFVARLRSLCARWSDSNEALRWPAFAGPHTCELCNEFRASGNLGIPAGGLLFVAPEMVAHYVERHRYLPPEAFIDAVMKTPTPGTPEFTEAVKPFVAGSAG